VLVFLLCYGKFDHIKYSTLKKVNVRKKYSDRTSFVGIRTFPVTAMATVIGGLKHERETDSRKNKKKKKEGPVRPREFGIQAMSALERERLLS